MLPPTPAAPVRELAWSPLGIVAAAPVPVPVVAAPVMQGLSPPRARPARVVAHARVEHRRAIRHTHGSTTVIATAVASTSVVLVQRTIVHTTAARGPHAGAAAPRTVAPRERQPPQAPLPPSGPGGPAAAGTAGASGHGGGASLLTAAAVAALALVALALLSSLVPASLPVRRRLSDDRQPRPG
ncbi:MAG TPA: hypothetical protein VFI04_02110 [Gaiellaceae bacterium]|nr:hypothetical protein [Gaiellaceae bacterium]